MSGGRLLNQWDRLRLIVSEQALNGRKRSGFEEGGEEASPWKEDGARRESKRPRVSLEGNIEEDPIEPPADLLVSKALVLKGMPAWQRLSHGQGNGVGPSKTYLKAQGQARPSLTILGQVEPDKVYADLPSVDEGGGSADEGATEGNEPIWLRPLEKRNQPPNGGRFIIMPSTEPEEDGSSGTGPARVEAEDESNGWEEPEKDIAEMPLRKPAERELEQEESKPDSYWQPGVATPAWRRPEAAKDRGGGNYRAPRWEGRKAPDASRGAHEMPKAEQETTKGFAKAADKPVEWVMPPKFYAQPKPSPRQMTLTESVEAKRKADLARMGIDPSLPTQSKYEVRSAEKLTSAPAKLPRTPMPSDFSFRPPRNEPLTKEELGRAMNELNRLATLDKLKREAQGPNPGKVQSKRTEMTEALKHFDGEDYMKSPPKVREAKEAIFAERFKNGLTPREKHLYELSQGAYNNSRFESSAYSGFSGLAGGFGTLTHLANLASGNRLEFADRWMRDARDVLAAGGSNPKYAVTNSLFNAAGYMTPQLVGGVYAKSAQLSIKATTWVLGLIGAGMGGGQGHMDAQEAGVTGSRAVAYTLIRAGLGFGTALVVGNALARFDGASGGLFSRVLLEQAGKPLTAALLGAFEASLAGMAHQMGVNAADQHLLGLEKDLTEGVGDAATISGILSLIFRVMPRARRNGPEERNPVKRVYPDRPALTGSGALGTVLEVPGRGGVKPGRTFEEISRQIKGLGRIDVEALKRSGVKDPHAVKALLERISRLGDLDSPQKVMDALGQEKVRLAVEGLFGRLGVGTNIQRGKEVLRNTARRSREFIDEVRDDFGALINGERGGGPQLGLAGVDVEAPFGRTASGRPRVNIRGFVDGPNDLHMKGTGGGKAGEQADGLSREANGKLSLEGDVGDSSSSAQNPKLSAQEYLGPYLEKINQLFATDPVYLPEPGTAKFQVITGRSLSNARRHFQHSGMRGHHQHPIAHGGPVIPTEPGGLVFTGEGQISAKRLDGLDLGFYGGTYGTPGAKVLKIHQPEPGGIFRFGPNPRHTRATSFWNEVERWQRANGVR